MYKVILKFKSNTTGDIFPLVFTHSDLEHCRKQIKIFKDIYASSGATIFELKIYKVEEIQNPDQI